MIKVESKGDVKALSHKGAVGYMQVMPQRGRDYYKHRYEDEGCLWALPLSIATDLQMRIHLRLTADHISHWDVGLPHEQMTSCIKPS